MDAALRRKQKEILLTWLPLAAMWIFMAVELPAISAVIARMSGSKIQLAAFGTAFALALFIEGPIVQMLAAGTALADSRGNYRRLVGLMHLIGWTATAVHGVLCIPAVFYLVSRNILGLPDGLIEPTRWAFTAMLPWSLAVGYRRLWQGVLIRHGRSQMIPLTMAIRLGASMAVLFWGWFTERIAGATLGALALSVGVVVGAITARFFVRPVISELPGEESSATLTWRAALVFYVPLALLNLINLGARPLMQIGLARGPMPIDSLALWPVVIGYLFLYTAISLSAQEVVIAKLGNETAKRAMVRFIAGIAVVLSVVYILVLATPLWRLWFSRVSGLTDNLTALAPSSLLLVFPVIPLSAVISLFRGALVRDRRTRVVTYGVGINVAVLLGGIFIGVAVIPRPAIETVSASFALAFIVEAIFLAARRPISNSANQTPEEPAPNCHR